MCVVLSGFCIHGTCTKNEQNGEVICFLPGSGVSVQRVVPVPKNPVGLREVCVPKM